MTITAVKSWLLEPASTAIDAPRFSIGSVHSAAVQLTDGSGERGFGYAYTFDPDSAEAVRRLIDGLADEYIGAEAEDMRAVRTRLLATRLNFLGVRGLARLAASALDMAAWDLLARMRATTVPGLVGAERDRQPVYSAYGLWSSLGPSECASVAAEVAKDHDTPHAKMWLGSMDLGREYERVAAVRESLGPDAAVIVDAAQAYDWRTASRLAQRLEDLDILWFEDPVEYEDNEGLSAFAAESPIPLGTGEHIYGLDHLKQLLDLGVTEYLVLDLERIGGVTDFLAAAALAEAYRVHLGTHVYTHTSVQLLAAARTGEWCEYSPLWDGYFGAPDITAGFITYDPAQPGIGLVHPRRDDH
jgi:mandelate racemase